MFHVNCFVIILLVHVFQPLFTTVGTPLTCDYGDCSRSKHQVCGSDNKTYDSLCDFLQAQCQANPALTVFHDGACIMPHVPKSRASHCDYDCHVDDPVCGTDGRTYTSECVIDKINCRVFDQHVLVKHHGPCV